MDDSRTIELLDSIEAMPDGQAKTQAKALILGVLTHMKLATELLKAGLNKAAIKHIMPQLTKDYILGLSLISGKNSQEMALEYIRYHALVTRDLADAQ